MLAMLHDLDQEADETDEEANKHAQSQAYVWGALVVFGVVHLLLIDANM
jgi:hypothetical protein